MRSLPANIVLICANEGADVRATKKVIHEEIYRNNFGYTANVYGMIDFVSKINSIK